MSRPVVTLLYGGRSAEHEISLVSARAIRDWIDTERWGVELQGITREGGWLDAADSERLLTGEAPHGSGGLPRLPEGTQLVFPVLHGPWGEDGTVQGWLELCGVPYVGSDTTGAALGMDKSLAKRVLRDAGLPVLPWVDIERGTWECSSDSATQGVIEALGLPVFVKPARLGSSVGVARAADEQELHEAVEAALAHGDTALVEPSVERCRELEVAILDDTPPVVSVPGEIRPEGWYDYEAKYGDTTAELLVPAPVTELQKSRLQESALAAFRALRLRGLARVDFLLDAEGDRLYLNEVNTMPGFTAVSMYPRLMEASGLPPQMLIDRLLQLASAHSAEVTRQRVGR